MLTTKVLRIILKGDFLCVGRERLWKKEQHRNQKALEKQRIRTALRELLWGGCAEAKAGLHDGRPSAATHR